MGTRVVCVVVALLTFSITPFAAPQESPQRLRITDARTAHFLEVGARRSPLLRELLDQIEAGDVVVYMGPAREIPARFAGRMKWIGAGGGYRYVRVSIRPDLAAHEYIATIAHELQHVIEVIDHPEVEDTASLLALYKRIGEQRRADGRVVWDTAAARAVGYAVKQEFTGRR
jgi:hypothetical protein